MNILIGIGIEKEQLLLLVVAQPPAVKMIPNASILHRHPAGPTLAYRVAPTSSKDSPTALPNSEPTRWVSVSPAH